MKNKINDIMTKNVLKISTETKFTEACRMFNNFGIHHLPVTDSEDNLLGLFSFTDAMKAFNDRIYNQPCIKEEGINDTVKIEDIMTSHQLYTLSADDDIKEALALFKKFKFNSIPITTDNKVVGILTTNDVIEHLSEDGE